MHTLKTILLELKIIMKQKTLVVVVVVVVFFPNEKELPGNVRIR